MYFKQKSNIILILKSPFKLINKNKTYLNSSTKLLSMNNTMNIYLKKIFVQSFVLSPNNQFLFYQCCMNRKYI